MDYCVPHGVPHSVFLGRVVRPGRDPLWTELDRGYALAWARNKASICPSCGTRHEEWDPKAGGDREAYVAAVHYCRGDAVLAEAQKQLPKGPDEQPIPGFKTYLRPRTDADDEDPDDD